MPLRGETLACPAPPDERPSPGPGLADREVLLIRGERVRALVPGKRANPKAVVRKGVLSEPCHYRIIRCGASAEAAEPDDSHDGLTSESLRCGKSRRENLLLLDEQD